MFVFPVRGAVQSCVSQSPLLDVPPPFLCRVSFVQMSRGKERPLSLQLPHWASLLLEILDCGCLRTSFKMYLAFLALGRLTYKLLAFVTGRGEALGVFSHLKPHVSITLIILIIFI